MNRPIPAHAQKALKKLLALAVLLADDLEDIMQENELMDCVPLEHAREQFIAAQNELRKVA